MRKEFEMLLDKYPYNPTKNRVYLDIIKNDPQNAKAKELLMMNFLFMAHKLFKHHVSDDMEILYFLNTSFDYAIGYYVEGKGMTFETCMRNALMNQLDLWMCDKNNIYIPRNVKNLEENKLQYTKLDAPVPHSSRNDQNITFGDIIADEQANDFEQDIEMASLTQLVPKYKEFLIKSKPSFLIHYERFQHYNTTTSYRETGEALGISHEAVRQSVRLFEKDFIKYLKSLKMDIADEQANDFELLEEYIYLDEKRYRGKVYHNYRVNIGGVHIGTRNNLQKARTIRDAYLNEQKKEALNEKSN